MESGDEVALTPLSELYSKKLIEGSFFMLILSRVCADFYDKKHNLLHRITASDLGVFRDVPEAIKEDPLFKMLVDDGSIKFPADAAKDKSLEQDPFAGATAEGKDIKPKKVSKPKTASKAKTEVKAEVKDEPGVETKPAEEVQSH